MDKRVTVFGLLLTVYTIGLVGFAAGNAYQCHANGGQCPAASTLTPPASR